MVKLIFKKYIFGAKFSFMVLAICTVGIMPLRAISDDRSEMVSQVLFGESLEVLEQSKNWAYVRLTYDKYEGWVDTKQFTIIDEQEQLRLSNLPVYYTTDLVHLLVPEGSKQMIPLVLGSHLPGLVDNKIQIANKNYTYDGSIIPASIETKRKQIIENAMMFINASYLWGGKTPFGVDCSGFSQMVYKISGINLPRDASLQALKGDTINFINDALIGDLAFFDNADGNIIHVGILLGDNKIIHASGKVRIDAIDHQGIFNVDTQTYSHKLRLIKSYL